MIDFTMAHALVEAELLKMKRFILDDDIIIMDDRTIERDFGWVFIYNTKRFVETGDHNYTLIGNAPIIVDRIDGSLHPTGTGRPIEEYIREYEKKRQYRK